MPRACVSVRRHAVNRVHFAGAHPGRLSTVVTDPQLGRRLLPRRRSGIDDRCHAHTTRVPTGRARGCRHQRANLRPITRRASEAELKSGSLERMWRGVYYRGEPDDALRLRGLDLSCGAAVAVCLGAAAAIYGFDTEEPADLHVLSPPGSGLRSADGLVVHRRDGAPLVTVKDRPATAPSWTAVEAARSLPRTLATLDAAWAPRPTSAASSSAGSSSASRVETPDASPPSLP